MYVYMIAKYVYYIYLFIYLYTYNIETVTSCYITNHFSVYLHVKSQVMM